MTRALGLSLAFVLATASATVAQEVTRVVNGDTIEVAGVGRVRLLGVDADDGPLRVGRMDSAPPSRSDPPRSAPPPLVAGRVRMRQDSAAQRYLQQLVLGRRVRLEYDHAASRGRGAARAYVFLEDGALVNEEMLLAGRARVDASRPFSRLDDFRAIEADARESHRGIWAEPTTR